MRFTVVASLAVAVVAGTFLSAPRTKADSSTSLQQQITAKEHEELEALKTGNFAAFGDLFADDTVFLDPHGFAKKAEVLHHSADFKVMDYSMDDVKVVPLSQNSGLIAYKLTQKVSGHGKEFSIQAFASAIWAERNGKWVCIFTQETPAKDSSAK
jgi:hypothetical protein